MRSRRWLVDEVVTNLPGESAIVRVACADDDAQGQALAVFWNYELDRRILKDEGWSDLAAKGFDPPRRQIWGQQSIDHEPGTGRRIVRNNPRSQWHIAERPDLRIISDELWGRAHKRRAAQQLRRKATWREGRLANFTHPTCLSDSRNVAFAGTR